MSFRWALNRVRLRGRLFAEASLPNVLLFRSGFVHYLFSCSMEECWDAISDRSGRAAALVDRKPKSAAVYTIAASFAPTTCAPGASSRGVQRPD